MNIINIRLEKFTVVISYEREKSRTKLIEPILMIYLMIILMSHYFYLIYLVKNLGFPLEGEKIP